ncbi:actin-related protein 6-like isoform X2 [Gordionus sp. m RMFG-2023]|uniref:actin-related protein 6-like isoform X2 n=1 Tax=Gordionus sp. m RMFG-2023 TaxID=3053472 RepID=UPI0031FD3707
MSHNKQIVILDNGGFTAKIGVVSSTYDSLDKLIQTDPVSDLTNSGHLKGPSVIPNCVTKAKSESRRLAFVGDQIDEIFDKSSLFYQRPIQRGYLVGWELQRQVWDRLFNFVLRDKYDLKSSPMGPDTELVVTVPPLNFPFITDSMNEIFFEEYGFGSVLQITPSTLSALRYSYESSLIKRRHKTESHNHNKCLVVDSGFSFTHVSHYDTNIDDSSVGKFSIARDDTRLRRLDVGGKLLTNYLKEIISYRQLHVMEESYVINQVKEDSCYVSQEFLKDMEACQKYGYIKPRSPAHSSGKGSVMANPALTPNSGNVFKGNINSSRNNNEESRNGQSDKSVNDDDYFQTLYLSNERITVPEIIFNPSDIGISQMGLPELMLESVADDQGYLDHVILTGGNTMFPGLDIRLIRELRTLTAFDKDVSLYVPKDPITYAWGGGALLPIIFPEFYASVKLDKRRYTEEGPDRAKNSTIFFL